MATSDTTQIRDFRESDLAGLMQLIHDTIDTSYQMIYPQQAINFFKAFHSIDKIKERSEKGKTIVLEKNGEFIGTGSLIDGKIFGIFIKPAHQKQGYGKLLMAALEQIAAAKSCTRISLPVSPPSRKFYESLGYSDFRECTIEVKNGKLFDLWKASKSLRNPADF